MFPTIFFELELDFRGNFWNTWIFSLKMTIKLLEKKKKRIISTKDQYCWKKEVVNSTILRSLLKERKKEKKKNNKTASFDNNGGKKLKLTASFLPASSGNKMEER